jgi:hypothetical protein
LGKLSVPLLVPGVFSRTWTVVDISFFSAEIAATSHAIACDHSNIAEIACNLWDIAKITWQSGFESRTTRRIEFDK